MMISPPFFMKREHSFIYMRVLKSVIITNPLFSQLIPSNPPHISWIRYPIKISMIFSFEYALNDCPKYSSNIQSLKMKFEFEARW
jgi:hypothetical protein